MTRRRSLLSLAWVLALTGCAATAPDARTFALELEGGAAWQSRNDVAVPGDTGTRVALDELTGDGPFPAGRVELDWQAGGGHELRGVVAPLRFSGTGTLDAPVDFAGATFAPGLNTHAYYRFDSYRLTWRYCFWDGEAWDWRLGLTANVRDAEIELEQGPVSARKTDTGLVPLVNFAGSWQLAPDWRLALEADLAAASQGRAIDASLKGYWRLRDDLELGIGYRTIEGGADNDEVYTFAWVHEAVVSLRLLF